MNFLLAIQVGLREIRAHKFRSFLTMFGIILGVSSLVSMFATIEGMTRGMREHLTLSGGVERVTVIDQEPPIGQSELKDMSPGRTMADVVAIRAHCPLIAAVSPEVHQWVSLQYMNKTIGGNTMGVTPAFLDVNHYDVIEGRFITDLDNQTCSRVCVVGWPVWEQLEQTRANSPLGLTLKLNDLPFRVVGVLRDFETEYDRKLRVSGRLDAWVKRAKERRMVSATGKGNSPKRWNQGWWKNNVVLIPIGTMQSTFKSASRELPFDERGADPKLSNLNLKVASPDFLVDAIDQVRAALLRVHRGVEDFGFDTRESWAESINTSIKGARLSGGIISGISLLVGGIGIANIMLASITERVREIGIRMAVGARGRDIFMQIIIESSVLGFLGGLFGLAASFGVVELIKHFADLNNEPVIQFPSLVISFAFSVVTGVLAGIYPAITAARLDPIQALRYE